MKYNCDSFSKPLAHIRFLYLCVYIALLSMTYAIPVAQRNINLFGILYTFMGVVGGVLLVVDLLCRQVMFTTKNCGLLILFFVAMVVSCISNIRYGFVENAKTLAWQSIQMFVIASIDTQLPMDLHKKHLRIMMEIFSAVWFIWAGWSLVQYISQFSQQVYLPEFDGYKNMGFAEGRLFGVFKDPNYAALCSVAAIVCAVTSIIMGGASVVNVTYHCIQISVQVCYIILSGSRSIQLGIVVAVVLLACLLGWKFAESRIKRTRWKVCVCILTAVLVFWGTSATFFVVKSGLSFLPSICSAHTSISPDTTQPDTTEPDTTDPDTTTSQITAVDLNRPDVVGDNVDITNNRLRIWKDYVEVFFSTPLFGTSPRNVLAYTAENFPDMYVAQKQYSVHNSYLVLFVCTGIVGGATMMLWLISIVVDVCGYLIRRRNAGDVYYNPILAMTFFLIVCAVAAFPLQFIFFTNSIYDVLFWVVLGYVRGFVQINEPERYSKTPLPYQLAKKILRR